MNVDGVAQVISVMQKACEKLRVSTGALGDNEAMKWSGVADVIAATIEEEGIKNSVLFGVEDEGRR